MKLTEILNIFAAVIVMTVVIGFRQVLDQDFTALGGSLIISLIVISISVSAKKFMASLLDTNVEHKVWGMSRYWLRPHWHLKNEIPTGIIFPLFFSIFTLGYIKFLGLLSYDASVKKTRAARRFGHYSFAELTEWHNGLIGAAGVFAVLVSSFVAYFPGFEQFSKIAIYYAFSSMIPFSKLDGTQIFFGSRVLYMTLALITLIFFGYALFVLQ